MEVEPDKLDLPGGHLLGESTNSMQKLSGGQIIPT
jgi:hypothetical protein